MKLAYLAFDKAGRQVADSLEADSVAEATETLHRRGLYVTQISPSQHGAGEPVSRRPRRFGRSGRLKHLAMFMRQLHVLVSSGTPLVQGLSALERQVKEGPWRNTIGDVRERVEQGASLSEAMEAHRESFSSVCRSLVAAGESSGHLPAMLDRLATMTRKQLHVRSTILGAIIYPSLLLTVTTGVLALLVVVVIPRFAELFGALDAPLPPTTQALIWLSKTLRSYWWCVLGSLIAAGVGLKLWLASPDGRRVLDTIALRLPQFGRIARSFATARIARLLGVLLDGHVPVLDALEMTRRSTRNCHYAELVGRARDAVGRGEPMSSAFDDPALISPSVYEAIHNGEHSGQVGPLLLNIADFLDDENEIIVRSLTSILEPVILVVMGLLVGMVAMSMFMPLFDLTSMTQGGAG